MKRTLLGVSLAIAVSTVGAVFAFRFAVPRDAPVAPVLPAAAAEARDAFPWDGVTVLSNEAGQRFSWTVARVEGEVHLTVVHPDWRVEHRAKPDGTPLFTVKQSRGTTTRVTWLADGVHVEHTDPGGKTSSVMIHELGLWDGSTLAARLAGVSWGSGQQVRLRIADLDLADGAVYPMIAEYVRQERCGDVDCHWVHVALDDFRRLVSPSFEFRYSTAPGAALLQYDAEGFTFRASGQ